MKVIQPNFYDDFVCLADQCPYTCCREWDISVDKKTALSWRKMPVPENERELLSSCIRYDDGDYLLKFDKSRMCRLLNERGLCKVVLAYGEENIPQTCHVFPREENYSENCTERALSPGCPAVLDLLWKKEKFVLTEASEGENFQDGISALRDWFMSLMDRPEKSEELLKLLFFITRDIAEITGKSKEALSPEFVKMYREATNVEDIMNVLRSTEGQYDRNERFRECNELFLDVLDRYVKQGKYDDFLKKAVPAANVFADNEYENANGQMELLTDFAESIEKNLKLLVWEEIGCSFALCANPESVLVKLEWIILEYIAIRQALYLTGKVDGSLPYEKLRETTAIMCRIMGYTDKDIKEFMKNEFQSLVWPADYLLLII